MIRSIAGVGSVGVVVVVTLVAGGCSSSAPSGGAMDTGSGSGGVGSSGSSSGSGSGGVGSSGSGSGGVGSSGSSGSGSGATGSSSGSSSGGGAGVNLPLVTPLVRAATPTGLQGSTQAYAFSSGFHLEDQPLGDGGDEGAPPGDTCPGSGGVCPDGGMNGGPGDAGGGAPPGDMCPGSGGVCPDGGMNGGPPGDGGGMPPPGGGDGGAGTGGNAGLDPADIRSRFFQAGPTNIFAILAGLDGRISEVNQRSANGNVPCLSATPVPYTLTPFGQSLTFYAQCVSDLSGPMDPGGFFEFGMKDGVIYLYEKIGAGAIGARITPVAEGSAQYSVDAWMGVGYQNAAACGNDTGFDDCSYGIMAIEADAERAHLELSVAGIGFGYCGAQLVSNGSTVYVAGSIDMGSMCDPSANACVSASNLTAAPACATTTFDLPAIGRAATSGPNGTWAASAYGSPSVVLNGGASDALAFGPSVATPGVGSFSMAMGGADGGAMNGPGNGPTADGGTE